MAYWDGTDTSQTSDAGHSADGGARAPSRVERLAPGRIAANVASIEAVPEELLGGMDRDWAFMWARRGYDVYACRDEDGVWYLWLATRCVELGAAPVARETRPGTRQRH